MKKVLLIETLSQINGGQKMSLLVSDMLRESGEYEVIWAIPEEGILSERLKEVNYQYYLLGDLTLPAGVKAKSTAFKYGAMSLRAITRILKIVRKEKIDIIYAPGPAALPWSAICGSIMHKRVIWHIHHIFEDGMTKKLLNVCGGMRSVRAIISVSKAASFQVENEKTKSKIEVIYNPVDVQKYRNGSVDKISISEPVKGKIKGDSPIVIEHIGLIHETKKQDFTIDFVHSLIRCGENAYAIIIGDFDSEGAAYSEKLQSMLIEKQLMDRVFFVGRQNNVEDWLQIATAVIIPSIEGLSLVALEAMAARRLVVATKECGVGEIVGENDAGLLFDDTLSTNEFLKVIRNNSKLEKFLNNGELFASENDLCKYCGKVKKIFND